MSEENVEVVRTVNWTGRPEGRPETSRILLKRVTYDRYHHLYRESEAEEREALNAYLRSHPRSHGSERPHK